MLGSLSLPRLLQLRPGEEAVRESLIVSWVQASLGSLKASPVENDGCPSLLLPQAVFVPFLLGMTQSEANLLHTL